MLNHTNVRPYAGSVNKSKRLGRGNGSGKGSFSGKGCKGQNARAGNKFNALFEGGQTRLIQRMPKLGGFTSHNAINYIAINLADVEKLAQKGITEITPEVLLANRVLSKKGVSVKLLAKGELTAKVTIHVHAFSAKAKEAVEKQGGTVDVVKA